MDKKITTKFLKLIRRKERVYLNKIGEFYWITDGFVMFRIPCEEFELNPKLFTRKTSLKRIIKEIQSDKYKEASLYCYKPINLFDNSLYAEFITKDKVKSCVNKKFLDLFKNHKFKVLDSLSPVICIDDKGEIDGCILPLRINQEEDEEIG